MLFFNKKMSPLLSLALDIFRPFSRFVSLACRLLSLFLCRSHSIFQICGHAVNLSLILQTTWIQKQFPLSVFVFIDSLVVSALQDLGGYAISRQNNLKLHLGCPTCWFSYFTLVCLQCGLTVGCLGGRWVGGCMVTWLPNFLIWVDLLSSGALPTRACEALGWGYAKNLSNWISET